MNQPNLPPTQISGDVLQAVAYCHLGGARPESAGSFHEARKIGLLAKRPCWEATERGEGALIAAGLLRGEVAGPYTTLAIRWATCEQYPTPQFVSAWHESAYEHATVTLSEAEQEFRDYGDPHDWHFFTTFTRVDLVCDPHPRQGDAAVTEAGERT